MPKDPKFPNTTQSTYPPFLNSTLPLLHRSFLYLCCLSDQVPVTVTQSRAVQPHSIVESYPSIIVQNAHLKRPAGMADQWGYALHWGICDFSAWVPFRLDSIVRDRVDGHKNDAKIRGGMNIGTTIKYNPEGYLFYTKCIQLQYL